MVPTNHSRCADGSLFCLQIAPRLASDPCGLDLLASMLTYDPAKRITAGAALEHPWFSSLTAPAPVSEPRTGGGVLMHTRSAVLSAAQAPGNTLPQRRLAASAASKRPPVP